MIAGILFGFVPLAIWLYLLLFHNGFWLLRERDTMPVAEPARWPSVVAVVPARNEADVIQRSIGSLIAQDYPGEFHIVLVDDQSDDGTGDLARALDSRAPDGAERRAAPRGLDRKIVGHESGQRACRGRSTPRNSSGSPTPTSPIAPDNLRRLVARAEEGGKVLVSLMARLSCKTAAEHFLIPAFVFFFDMLFPFGAVNDPKSQVAAAAGGCMLARRAALEKAGGIAAIRHNIIDDCALGRAMKRQGPIWLGLTDRAVSLAPLRASVRHPPDGDAHRPMPSSAIRRWCWRAPCWGWRWSISRR